MAKEIHSISVFIGEFAIAQRMIHIITQAINNSSGALLILGTPVRLGSR